MFYSWAGLDRFGSLTPEADSSVSLCSSAAGLYSALSPRSGMMVSKKVDIMYRSLAIRLTAIIVILAAMATTLAAQGRGFRGGVSVFRGAPAVRSAPGPAFFSHPVRPIVANPVPPFVSSPVAPPLRGGPFFFGGLSHTFGRFPRTIVVPSVGGYYSPYIWPTTIYGYGGPAYYPYPASVYSEPAYAAPAASAPTVSQGEVDLAYQIGRLSQEIEQLRQQQTITSYTQPPAPSQVAAEQRTPTVLVFRDGRRMEIQNYAIVGQMLWVFNERAATKIPLSDLDLDATQKENRGSGFRFPLQEK